MGLVITLIGAARLRQVLRLHVADATNWTTHRIVRFVWRADEKEPERDVG